MDETSRNTTADTEMLVCPSCGSRIEADVATCPICDFPIGTTANLDPIGAIHGEGRALVRATEVRPKPIIVFGVWLIFLPMMIGSAAVAIDVMSQGSGSGASGFLFFWGGIALSILSAVFLFKVTRNYLKQD